ncbi:MAG: hypothetical protein IJS96_08205 [Schwartzia sp.]|nr:hypothetical protein [Schwartzia sp. (in: firmicutes)]
MGAWLINLVRRKPVAKILSLLAATGLWFFVMNEQNPMMDTTFNIPVTMVDVPEKAKITPEFETVQVKLRGPRSVFATTGRDEIKAEMDLASLGEGKHHLRLQTVVPQGMEVISVLPDSMDVTIDPYRQKKMPVNLIRTGSPAPGMAVAGMTPETATVTVFGTHSALDTVEQVVAYVNLNTDHNRDFNLETPVQAMDNQGQIVEAVRVVPKTLAVHVQLARGLARKVVAIQPVFEGVVADGCTIVSAKAEPARIEIAGEASVIEKLDFLNTAPVVVAGLNSSVRRVVSLSLPEGVTVSNKLVEVSIGIEKR